MTARFIPLVLLVATTAQAQSVKLTNDDLGRRHAVAVPLTADVWAGLQARAYRAPMNYASPHVFDVVPLRQPSATPWEFPPPRLERRLDGTLLTDPPTVYVSYELLPTTYRPRPRVYDVPVVSTGSERRHSERETRTPLGRPAGLTQGGRSSSGSSWGMAHQTTRQKRR